MAEYLASPVQMNTQIIYEIRDYGSAMAPYYVMLALFVGSLLTAVMVKVPVTQPEFRQCRGVQRYFGRFLTYFCMAMAQALVTAFGCLHFVGMETAEPALFVLGCCVCALNFAAMNYALVYSLDNVGLAASVIIMVLQVAGSGGSYPIDVLPQLFRRLYPFMPFHYGMDMLRETIGGMYGRTYLRCALILLGMCVLFTVFGLLVYYPARKLNAAIAASQEKSGIVRHGLDAQDLADAHHRVEGGPADTVMQGTVDGGEGNVHRESELPHAAVLPRDLIADQLRKIVHISVLTFCKEFPLKAVVVYHGFLCAPIGKTKNL